MALCAATLVVLCTVAATGAAAQGTGGWGTAVQGANNTLHFVWAGDGQPWHDATIGSAYGPPSIARFTTSASGGWGIAVQGASNSLHFVYAVDGQPFNDVTVGAAYGPPSIARFTTSASSGWGIAVQGANNSLHFLYAVDGQPFNDQAIGAAYAPPSIARFSNAAGAGWGIAVQGASNTLHFVYAVDGQPFNDQTIGSAYGPPSMTRYESGETPSSPPATGVVTGPVSTPLPLPKPHRRHSLRVKLTLTWTWQYGTTWLDKATIGRFPADMRLTVRCLGRRCPHPATASATGRRRVRRLLRALGGHRYEVGERLRITLTAPGFRPEVAAVIFRYGRLPATRLLRS